MKKNKIFLPFVALALTFGLVACGGSQGNGGDSSNSKAPASSVPQKETIRITAAGGKTAIGLDETLQLTPSVDGVAWSTSDNKVATVNDAGLVTAVGKGEVTIIAKKDNYNDGRFTLEVKRMPTKTLHMEDAEHFAADGEWSSSNNPTVSPAYDKSNASDGTTCAHFGAGDIETVNFTSSKAVKAEIALMIGYYYSIDDLRDVFDVKFNGEAVSFAQQGYEAEDTTNYTYKEISFGELNLKAETNVLQIMVKANANNRFPYMDDLNIYAAEAVTITLVQPQQKDPVTVNQENVSVAAGKTSQITSSMTGLSYVSVDPSVATVDATGLVSGVKVGSTYVVITKEGNKPLGLAVTVTEGEGVIVASIKDMTGEGITTRSSQNLTAPNNYIVDEFPEGATGTLKFTAKIAGTYNLYMNARASGGYSSSTTDDLSTCMELKIDGNKINLTGTVSGSFKEYLLGEVTLEAGERTLTLKCLTTVPTINLFRLVPKA